MAARKRRAWRPLSTSAIVIALTFSVGAAPARAAEDPCAPATALLNAGLISQAEARFEQLSTEAASQACAETGLEAVVDERIERAETVQSSLESDGVESSTIDQVGQLVRSGDEDNVALDTATAITAGDGFAIARALKTAGYPGAATGVLTDAIVADPDAEVPTDLQALAAAAGVHLFAAKALANAGLDTEANEELKLALQEDPTLDVPEELASPTRRPDVWRDALGTVGPWLRALVEVLIAFAVLIGLLILGIRAFQRRRMRIYAETFGGAKDDAQAAPTTAAVQEEYGRLIRGNGGVMLKVIGPSAEATSQLPKDVVAVIPSGNVLVAAVVWVVSLLPDPVARQLTGLLRPQDPKRGAGLSLTLARKGGLVFAEVTLWEDEFGTPAPQGEKDKAQPAYDNLSVPAAVWLMYAGHNSKFRIRRKRLLGRLGREPLQILGATNWRSHAQFAVGARAQIKADWRTARRRYLDAIARDPANQGAMFNLAAAELQLAEGDPDLHPLAVSRLAALRATLEARTETENPLWYRVLNNQVVAWINPHPQWAKPGEARMAAVKLCAHLFDGLSRIKESETEDRGELRDFLEQNEAGALVLLASALLVDGRPDAGTRLDPSKLGVWLSGLDNGSIGVDEFDKHVTHPALVKHVETAFGPVGVECAYNLACYYTRRAQRAESNHGPAAELWSKASAHLRNAIDLGGWALGEWAKQDPVLAPFRRDKAREDTLKKIVDERKDPESTVTAPGAEEDGDKEGLGALLEILRGLVT